MVYISSVGFFNLYDGDDNTTCYSEEKLNYYEQRVVFAVISTF